MAEGTLWPAKTTPLGMALPFGLAIAFVFLARHKSTGVNGRVAAEKLKRYGATWEALYGASWLLAVGLVKQATWLAAFALACFLMMTVVKNLTALATRPLGFRG